VGVLKYDKLGPSFSNKSFPVFQSYLAVLKRKKTLVSTNIIDSKGKLVRISYLVCSKKPKMCKDD
jgi:hypothetical protein